MSISTEEVNRIAWLARLAIESDKTDAYAHDLSGILNFIEQMSAVDTAAVEPMAHPLDAMPAMPPIHLRLRPDEASEPNDRQANQRSAPAVERGLFLVPKVIE